MTWVQIVDQSRDPITDYAAAYAAGVRVLASYAGLGSAPKWMTAAQIARWRAAGPDTGILALAEGTGREPVDSPGLGASHGRTARAAWHALGLPDEAAICYAVDTDISTAQARGAVQTYFRAVAGADACRPLAYVERDAGELLHAAGVIAGYGTPAAYGWDPSGRLVTPTTAPAACVWTQEHNGVQRWGGTIDLGHIRTTAPIWWLHQTGDSDMPLTTADTAAIAKTLAADLPLLQAIADKVMDRDSGVLHAIAGDPAAAGKSVSLATRVSVDGQRLARVETALAALSVKVGTITPAAFAAAVVAALPPAAEGGLTVAQVEQAVHDGLATLTLTTTTTVEPGP